MTCSELGVLPDYYASTDAALATGLFSGDQPTADDAARFQNALSHAELDGDQGRTAGGRNDAPVTPASLDADAIMQGVDACHAAGPSGDATQVAQQAGAPGVLPQTPAQAGADAAQSPGAVTPTQAPGQANVNRDMTLGAAGLATLLTSEGQVNGGAYYNDVANNCTRGTGILVHPGTCTASEMARPTDQQANETAFQNRVHTAEDQVRQQVPDRRLTQDQFDNLVSATFNLGGRGAAPVLDQANRNNDQGVVQQLRDRVNVRPRDAGGHVTGPAVRNQGLVNRRERELAPFLHLGPTP